MNFFRRLIRGAGYSPLVVTLLLPAIVLSFGIREGVNAQSTLIRAWPKDGQSGLVQAADYWRFTGDVLVPGSGTVFIPLPGNVATLPNGIIVQDGLDVVITDVFVGGVELVNLVRAAQAGPGNQVLVFGDHAVNGYQSGTGVLLTGESALGVGLGLRKAVQGGADVIVRLSVSGRVAN